MTCVNDNIPLTPHTSYYNSIGYTIIRYNLISETIPFACMSLFVSNESIYIRCRKIVFGRYGIFLSNVNKVFGHFFLRWVFKVLFFNSKIFSKAYNVYTFSMLWYTEIHCIYNFRIRDYITDFI